MSSLLIVKAISCCTLHLWRSLFTSSKTATPFNLWSTSYSGKVQNCCADLPCFLTPWGSLPGRRLTNDHHRRASAQSAFSCVFYISRRWPHFTQERQRLHWLELWPPEPEQEDSRLNYNMMTGKFQVREDGKIQNTETKTFTKQSSPCKRKIGWRSTVNFKLILERVKLVGGHIEEMVLLRPPACILAALK